MAEEPKRPKKFRWNGVEYPVLTRPTWGEIAHCERLLKDKSDNWSTFENGRAEVYLAIRRVDHTALPWDAMEDLSPEDFEPVKDPEESAATDGG